MIWVDYLIIGMIICFVIMGILSGFVKYSFSLVGLILAPLFTNKFISTIYPWVFPFLQKFINHPKTIFGISWIVIFWLIYISSIFVGILIHKLITLSRLNFLNRLLGGVFGLIQGWIVIVILYHLIALFFPIIAYQIEQSYSYPFIKKSIQVVKEEIEKAEDILRGKDFFFHKQ